MLSEVKKHNDHYQALYDKGELSADGLRQALAPMPEKLKPPSNQWCRAFSERFGWSLLSSSSEQASLPFDSPDMELSRKQFSDMIKGGVHPALVLNFDQVWRCAYSCSAKMFWKAKQNVGRREAKKAPPKSLDKKHHAVRGARKSLTVPWNHFRYLTAKYYVSNVHN